LLARLCEQNSGPLPQEMVVQLFQQIIDTLKQLQR
jgi:chorismate mutase